MSPFRTPRRSVQRELDERRSREADIRYRHYVRPHGNRGLHVVKAAIDGREYVVSGPGRTFQPGTVVPTGSNTGNQGEFIVTDPPPGRRGAGNFPPNTIVKHSCPRCIKNRSYIGITDSGATDVLTAWDYLDGQPLSQLGSVTLTGDLATSGDTRTSFILVNPSTVAFIARITGGSKWTVGIWNIGGAHGRTLDDQSNTFRRIIFSNNTIWVGQDGGALDDAVWIRRGPATIGASFGGVATIEVNGGGSNEIFANDIAVVSGQGVCWSDELHDFPAASDTRWCKDGVKQFGPPLIDVSNTSRCGVEVTPGVTLVDHVGPFLVGVELTEKRLWPIGWSGGEIYVAISNNNEYAAISVFTLKGVRLPLKDYSGVDPSVCSLPTFDIIEPGVTLEALLPI